MKNYKNRTHGFEIDIPKHWPNPIELTPESLVFNCTPKESLNFVVGPLIPERISEYTEFEFRQYAQKKGYSNLDFGRISVGNKNHVWARYNMGGLWTKKYMIVFGGIEYSITATCYFPEMLTEMEKVWDAVVGSFLLSKEREEDIAYLNLNRSQIAGELYAQAYELISRGIYMEACNLLNQCLENDPDHILAHKELAFILKNTGDVKGALPHRQIVKRLDPSDKVNCFNLAGILAMLGEKETALQEIEELLLMEPDNPVFNSLRKAVLERLI